ncbi:MAG TPA: sigma-70 family RNA polymerase sigma factor [Nannocystaceae bacterium]|nr:sigma-70 family RNA polymerase sigma factor [Nannocystaceae bacterium]
MPTDFELLAAWRAGDIEAGNTLVRRHFLGLYAFVRAKVPEAADDLIQKIWEGCVQARDRIDERASFKAYLFGIARRQLVYFFREARRDRDHLDTMVESIAQLSGSPSRHVALREEQHAMLTALNGLPLDLQIALELYYWEELSVADVAAVLDVPEGTVKSRLHRARQLLREQLDQAEVGEDAELETLKRLRGALVAK